MIELQVNGHTHSISADADTPLLYVLRDELELNAAKFGCGLGQCGACTVLVDGVATLSCVTPILLLAGRRITTLEGLGTEHDPGPLQQAFIDEQAAQCGYCIPGMMLRAQALLQRDLRVSDADIRRELEHNLCRCGTHLRILRAVRRAAASMLASGNTNTTPADPPQHASYPDTPEQPDDGIRRPAHPDRRERPER